MGARCATFCRTPTRLLNRFPASAPASALSINLPPLAQPETTDDDFAVNTPNAAFMGPRPNPAGGAKGVGESTTSAVVISLVLIFVADFGLSFLFFQGQGDALKSCM